MNFKTLLDDIKKLINLPLKAITPSTADIILLSIDDESNKYTVKNTDTGREIKRNIKELEDIFYKLKKDGYCNVEQVLQGSNTSRHQPETIFANLPYIYFFKFERRKHLIFIEVKTHNWGEIQELPRVDQTKVRKALSSNKLFNKNLLASELQDSINALKKEIHNLNIKEPGFLADTKIREILSELENINNSVQETTVSFINKTYEISDNTSELIKSDSFDMSDLVNLSSFTGITDDENLDTDTDTDTDTNHNENTVEKDEISTLLVPNIRRQTPSLYSLYQRLNYEEIEIQPDYQRKDRIWADDKKSKLIESILMGLPLPIFYFGERKNDNWVVIDGLQRLTTVYDFMQGKFALKLEKNSPVYEVNGKFYTDFTRPFTRAINEFDITAYVIDMDENSNNKYVSQFIIELFHRINTYGVKLSDQEIRSAIKFGNSVYYLKFLASTKTFKSATNNIVNPKRQKDLELCLGALAFIIFGYKSFSFNRYDDFLTTTMDWINKQDFKKIIGENNETDYKSESIKIVELTRKFESSLNFCKEIFGTNAFKKVINSKKQEPISKTFFEVLVTLFANIDEKQKNLIRLNKAQLINKLYSAIKNDSEEFAHWSSDAYNDKNRGLNYSLSTSTGKKVTIEYRFESIMKIIELTTGCKIKIIPEVDIL